MMAGRVISDNVLVPQNVEELRQCIIWASDPMNNKMEEATNCLNQMHHYYEPSSFFHLCYQLLERSVPSSYFLLPTSTTTTSNNNINNNNNHINTIVFYALNNINQLMLQPKNNNNKNNGSNNGMMEKKAEDVMHSQYYPLLRQLLFQKLLSPPLNDNGYGDSPHLLVTPSSSPPPTYLRNKVSVTMARLIQADFLFSWNNAFDDLTALLVPSSIHNNNGPIINNNSDKKSAGREQQQQQQQRYFDEIRTDYFLRILQAFHEEVVQDIIPSSNNEDNNNSEHNGLVWKNHRHLAETNTAIKDIMRGYYILQYSVATQSFQKINSNSNNSNNNNNNNMEDTIVARLVHSVLAIFHLHRPSIYNNMISIDNNSNDNNTSLSPSPTSFVKSQQEQEQHKQKQQQLALDSLKIVKAFCSWIDISLLVPNIMSLLLESISQNNPQNQHFEDDDDVPYSSQLAVTSLECLSELIHRCYSSTSTTTTTANGTDAILRFLQNYNILPFLLPVSSTILQSNCHNGANIHWNTLDDTHILVVLQAAELINTIGVYVLPTTFTDNENNHSLLLLSSALWDNLMTLLFHCFAYDDIDVSAAVIPLILRFISTILEQPQTNINNNNNDTDFILIVKEQQKKYVGTLVDILFRQMPYPQDFEFNYSIDDITKSDEDAEEEQYRDKLRNVYKKLITVCPKETLDYLCQSISTNITPPLSAVPNHTMEASLRLVYHYCEGLQGGLKYLQKNTHSTPSTNDIATTKDSGVGPQFCQLLVALVSSDVRLHPHREVLLMYYNIITRYSYIFKIGDGGLLLSPTLESLSGTGGLQHAHPRVRSRSCYLLLKLVQSLGKTLRNYVDTAVSGIQQLLLSSSIHNNNNTTSSTLLTPDDSLYLFETIGLLLGRTGLDVDDQQRYLTAVMTPHVQSMEKIMMQIQTQTQQSPSPTNNQESISSLFEHEENILSNSIASIAFVSKGFRKPTPPEIQLVLSDTLPICLNVLLLSIQQSLRKQHYDTEQPNSSTLIRNKIIIYLQRMLQSLNDTPFLIENNNAANNGGIGETSDSGASRLLSLMPQYLNLLIENCTHEEILDVAQLLYSICTKFKSNSLLALDGIILPFLRKVHEVSNNIVTDVATNTTVMGQQVVIDSNESYNTKQASTMIPPHLLTEQLSIQKLSYYFLYLLVSNQLTDILLSSTNAPSLESILQSVGHGAIHVNDPIIKRTCIQFFHELITQWGGDGIIQILPQSSSFIVTPSTEQLLSIQNGFLQYVVHIFIPGVFQCMLRPTFKERDAMYFRNVTEMAAVLDTFKVKRGVAEFEKSILSTILSPMQCPLNIMEEMKSATNKKEMTKCLRQMITLMKQK